MFDSRITILVGHFGSGKTELAVHGARILAQAGVPVSLVDLDVVKPYFRSRSSGDFLVEAGVELVAPSGEFLYADLPIILPRVRSICRDHSRRVIMDVGGDDTGARVLGSLEDVLEGQSADLLLVLNFRRPFTPDVDGALAMAAEIQAASRRMVTGIVSNTHLMGETTAEVVLDGLALARSTAQRLGVPVRALAVEEGLAGIPDASELGCEVLVMRRAVRPPFDEGPSVRTSGPLFVLK
jgi:energy-coupling factor transporter ATP-binding protein EcfA2